MSEPLSQTKTTGFRFLDLPGELRNKIYNQYFASNASDCKEVDTSEVRGLYPATPLTEVSHQVRSEAKGLFDAAVADTWASHTLTFSCFEPDCGEAGLTMYQQLRSEIGDLDNLPGVNVQRVRFDFEPMDDEEEPCDGYLSATIGDDGAVVWDCSLGQAEGQLERSALEWSCVVELEEAMKKAVAEEGWEGKGLCLEACAMAVSYVSTPRMLQWGASSGAEDDLLWMRLRSVEV